MRNSGPRASCYLRVQILVSRNVCQGTAGAPDLHVSQIHVRYLVIILKSQSVGSSDLID